MLSFSTLAGLATTILLAASHTSAHPGHDIEKELADRATFLSRAENLHSKCGKQHIARNLHTHAAERRADLVRKLRAKRGISNNLEIRDVNSVLSKDHHSNLDDIEFDTDPSKLFSGNASCLLQPETTEGPYYVSGELIREDMREDQTGIEMILDLQFIDTTTCKPLKDQFIEFWSCNATVSFQ